jgi:hypothetical protein
VDLVLIRDVAGGVFLRDAHENVFADILEGIRLRDRRREVVRILGHYTPQP